MVPPSFWCGNSCIVASQIRVIVLLSGPKFGGHVHLNTQVRLMCGVAQAEI